MKTSIDEKTDISLYAVICCLPFIAGGIIWLTTINAKADQSAADISGLKALVLDIRERVIRIEANVESSKKSHGGH